MFKPWQAVVLSREPVDVFSRRVIIEAVLPEILTEAPLAFADKSTDDWKYEVDADASYRGTALEAAEYPQLGGLS